MDDYRLWMMTDAERLRDRATRLLALALKAREEGRQEHADELTQLASEALDQATEIEQRRPMPQQQPQQVAQQQQQPQAEGPSIEVANKKEE